MIRIFLVLLFVFPSPALAEADGPDAWQVYGVSQGGTLHMRKGPSKMFSVVAKIPFNAQALKNLGCHPEFNASEWENLTQFEKAALKDLRWCKVRYNDQTGWVFGQYLEEY